MSLNSRSFFLVFFLSFGTSFPIRLWGMLTGSRNQIQLQVDSAGSLFWNLHIRASKDNDIVLIWFYFVSLGLVQAYWLLLLISIVTEARIKVSADCRSTDPHQRFLLVTFSTQFGLFFCNWFVVKTKSFCLWCVCVCVWVHACMGGRMFPWLQCVLQEPQQFVVLCRTRLKQLHMMTGGQQQQEQKMTELEV